MVENNPKLIDFNHPRVREFFDQLLRITAGEYDLHIPISRERDELDAIAHAVNVVIDELNREKQAAQKATAQKSRFLGGISHEIRTPISAILNYSHFLEDGQVTPEERQRYIGKIAQNCSYLLGLIESLMDLSKVEARLVEKKSDVIALGDELQSIAEFCELKAREKNLQFHLEIDMESGIFVELDKTKFRQVVLNLANNALKFTKRGHVSVRCFRGPAGRLQDALCIEVQDTGIGISQEHQKDIFDDFHRIDHQSKEGGIGLGLGIAKSTAVFLGGDVMLVHSRLGYGSKFLFYLPVTWLAGRESMPKPGAALVTSARAPRSAGKILLAEDSRDLAEIFQISFRKENIPVTCVENGQRALDILTDQSFDVIVMDYEMPVLDGVSAIKALRERGVATPVIMLTAHTQSDKLNAGYAVGANLVLTKPILGPQLVDAVRDMLESAAPMLH